jgi:SagB-type dehydrogenase family enzyme
MRPILAIVVPFALLVTPMRSATAQDQPTIGLPAPATRGAVSLEETLRARRSVRGFTDDAMSLAQLGQLLWAAQGITDAEGHRTAPSAGARYPIELYVVAANVAGLTAGVYKYRPREHDLVRHLTGDRRARLVEAAVRQDWILTAAAVFAITSVDERTRARYRDRTERYVAVEAGHVGQNICLQAVALGLGTTVVGAFQDDSVSAVLELDRSERPIVLIPVGTRPSQPRGS